MLKCEKVDIDCNLPCPALQALHGVYGHLRDEQRYNIIRDLRPILDIRDSEVAEDLQKLAVAIISQMPELHFISDFGIKIGYVRSWEKKMDKGRIVHADCRKVGKVYGAYLPFDFLITFYEPNIGHMTENQKKILMLHELKHIGVGEKGYRIEPHDVEDFESILTRYGLNWSSFDQDVPDILEGERGAK
ncbi:putative metallopeptidase [Paenibacillus alkalitolerans]|uniref:putative metallopeptidase n=1 Tax=Paenibacillus alkalitolerans TaxID=2799335 RepID=UPI0018F383BE|nr:putative metallopeptidase [Paenibacillus alkalitolerans]